MKLLSDNDESAVTDIVPDCVVKCYVRLLSMVKISLLNMTSRFMNLI